MRSSGDKHYRTRLLASFLKGSAILFAIAIIASAAVTFLCAVIPKIIGFTIDSVLSTSPVPSGYAGIVDLFGGLDNLKSRIWIIALVIAGIALVAGVMRYCQHYFNHRANQTMMRRMRNTLFSHIQRLPLSWQAHNNTGDIIQRCTSDADTISQFISNQLTGLFNIIFMLALSLVFMFTINVKLAAIASAFIPLIVGLSVLFHFKSRAAFKRCDENEGILSTYAQENLTGVRVVRAFGREKYERDKFDGQNNYYTGLWVRLEKFLALFWSASDLLSSLQLLCIIVIGTVLCVDGSMTAGDLVAFISYNTMLIGPIRQLGRIISNLSKAGVALNRIADVMRAPEEDYGADEGELSGDIVFDNVCFGYDKTKEVLHGVSFTVPYGGTLGIIGGTGSGKSTVACLMDGLYAPDSGTITLGGRDITALPPATLRANIGFVMQESYIYSRTVGENIGMAKEGATPEQIKAAAELACIDESICSFSDGYDTVVGERGVTLSGGQRQRVAIARTLLRGTPYLIFDDSLSAVDAQTDAQIRAKLFSRGDRTTVIISHRINTVMHADKIIVLDGGRVVEQGDFNSLLAANGIFKRIYDLQSALPDELTQ